MQSHIELGEEEARLAIDTAVAELKKRGKVASIAVGDRHGEMIALWRMNGASLPSAVIAGNKVYTSARTRRGSGDVGRKVLSENGTMAYYGSERYVGWDGGVAVMIDGKCAGAVALSGLAGEEDLEIAELAVAAILKSL